MKQLTLVLLLIFTAGVTSAQSLNEIDSLVRIARASDDLEAKTNAYGYASFVYATINYDSAIYYATKTLELCQKSGNKDSEARAYMTFGAIEEYSQHTQKAIFYNRKALALLSEMNDTLAISDIYSVSGRLFLEAGQYDSALIEFDAALAMVAERGWYYRTGMSHFEIASVYERMGKHKETMAHLAEARRELLLHINTEPDTEKNNGGGLADIYSMEAGIWLASGNYLSALTTYQKALHMFDSLGNTLGNAMVLDELADLYQTLGDMEEAKSYHLKAEKLFRSINDDAQSATVLISLSLIYDGEGEYAQAITARKKALTLLGDANPEYTIKLNSGLSASYLALGVLDSAEHHADIAMTMANEVSNDPLLGIAHLAKGRVAMAKKGYAHSLELTDKALAFFQESGNISLTAQALEVLSECHSALGHFQQAYAYQSDFLTIHDSISTNDKDRDLARAEAKFAFEKEKQLIESEKEVLEKEKRIQQVELGQQQTFLAAAGLAILALVAVASLLYHQKQAKLRESHVLDQKNQVIEKALHEKQLLLKEIHHRVKNNFQMISSLLELQTEDIEDDKMRLLAEEGQNRIKSMALIHQRLYQNDELLIHFDEYVEKLVQELATAYDDGKPVAINVNASGAAYDVDTAIPLGLIINELVTNSFKYGFGDIDRKLEISLKSKQANELHRLTVRDSGKGLPEGFDLTKAQGIGLTLIRLLSRQLRGRFSYAYNSGAEFTIEFMDTATRTTGD